MANLKSLAKDTAIYGMSSIIGRFLNYLLVPLYTAKISAASGGYGVITNIYAYTALLLVVLTYGMETTFFRYANKTDQDPKKVYSTTLSLVGLSSLLFIAMVFVFLQPICDFMGYSEHPSYVWVMAVTVAIDAFQAIPFAYLRYKKRPIKFATFKLLFIALNIILNLVYYLILDGHEVGYAFYINLVCTTTITFCFWKELKDGFFAGGKLLDMPLAKKMLSYTWPILFLGIAGILNQTAGYIIFPYVYKDSDAHTQLGIFGAASKIAMIMSMITQAFRYAYEPFVLPTTFGQLHYSICGNQYDSNLHVSNKFWHHLSPSSCGPHNTKGMGDLYIFYVNPQVRARTLDHLCTCCTPLPIR